MAAEPVIRPIASPAEYEEALAIRIAVFVDEQGGPLDEEPDEWDAGAEHFVVLDGARIVGAARIHWPEAGVAKLGRIVLLPEYRGRGWGARLMEYLVDRALGAGARELVLHAQTYALAFYARHGFIAEGPEFEEGNIPHRRMRRRARDE